MCFFLEFSSDKNGTIFNCPTYMYYLDGCEFQKNKNEHRYLKSVQGLKIIKVAINIGAVK